jgi:hypothetical protein
MREAGSIERSGWSGAASRKARHGLAAVLAGAALFAAGVAGAGPLPFTGSLALSIASYGIGIPGRGVADVTPYGHLESLGLPSGVFSADGLTVTITAPTAAPVGGLQITAENGVGAFVRPNGGAMAIAGFAKVCVFGPCSGALANLTVPLSVIGAGGTATAEGAINVTVIGAPWTTGTAVVGTETAMGYARGAAGNASSTAAASGEIQLVTPVRILTNLSADLSTIAGFGVLTLHFVPEPSTLVLLAGGLIATTALGSRSKRRE